MEPTMRQMVVSGLLVPEHSIDPEPLPIPQPPLIPVGPPPPLRRPYFDVGDARGAPGETVHVKVEAGCSLPMSGFHIGGGFRLLEESRSGYGKFKATSAILGSYLTRYLRVGDVKFHTAPDEVGDHYFSTFQFMDWETDAALPEEWWEFAVGLFSIEHEGKLPPVPIPSGTHLFTLELEILPSTPPGRYELTCKDEWYYLHGRQRRRKFEFAGTGQGLADIETFGGWLTVT